MTTSQNRFIPVPTTTLPNGLVVPAFHVAQFAASQGADGKVESTAEGTPWVNIDHADSRRACEESGFALITETQWLAIAWDAARQDCNWTGGAVGEGSLFQGLRDWSVDGAQPGTYEPEDKDKQNWLTLSNGQRIHGINGNVYQWIFDDVQGDENGVTAKPFAEDSASLLAPFPSMEKGMGWRPKAGADWSGDALIRGGCWDSASRAGAFCLLSDWPGGELGYVGFRCTHPGL